MQQSFLDCVLVRWQPGINDPYLVSWIMVAIYAFAALLALVVARRAPFPAGSRQRERRFWVAVAIVAALMAVNKQEDLQTLLIASGSCVLHARGWSQEAQWIEGLTIVVLIALALGIGAGALRLLRRTSRRTALPLLGLALMAGFVAFRAVEILFFVGPLRALSLNDWADRVFELAGPAVVIGGALLLLDPRRRESQTAGHRGDDAGGGELHPRGDLEANGGTDPRRDGQPRRGEAERRGSGDERGGECNSHAGSDGGDPADRGGWRAGRSWPRRAPQASSNI